MKYEELIEHPEGGRFKEVFRSDAKVSEGGRTRSAVTHIYFSLNAGEVSRFHRVDSDEIWNLYEGAGIDLYIWNPENGHLDIIELSQKKKEYCGVVPAGFWQAAKPINEKVLVGCSVSPGFEFEDFELIDPDSQIARRIRDDYPDLDDLL